MAIRFQNPCWGLFRRAPVPIMTMKRIVHLTFWLGGLECLSPVRSLATQGSDKGPYVSKWSHVMTLVYFICMQVFVFPTLFCFSAPTFNLQNNVVTCSEALVPNDKERAGDVCHSSGSTETLTPMDPHGHRSAAGEH